jgi:hypothetical protein
VYDPADQDQAELDLMAAQYPEFRIWREHTDDGIRYSAQALALTTRPSIIVTGDLAELRAALAASSLTPAELPARRAA